MRSAQYILRAAVSLVVRDRVRTLAEQQLITESVWLRQLVIAALRAPSSAERSAHSLTRAAPATLRNSAPATDDENAPAERFTLCLRPEDRRLLRERASARSMQFATYAAVLLRAHLRNLPPLPKDELITLKRTVAELGAIGRKLNQLARAANSGDQVAGLAREDLLAMIQVCEAVRANVKALILANLISWEMGYAEPES